MHKQKGFSLIELLIVVAIILIIAAIAIPNLLRARIAANEASAVGSIRTINTSEVTYNSTYQQGYGTLAQLGPGAACPTPPTAATACLVDSVLAGGAKSGYAFVATPAGANNVTYTAKADPSIVGTTGNRHFCSDESGVIRFNAAATCVGPPFTDAPIQ